MRCNRLRQHWPANPCTFNVPVSLSQPSASIVVGSVYSAQQLGRRHTGTHAAGLPGEGLDFTLARGAASHSRGRGPPASARPLADAAPAAAAAPPDRLAQPQGQASSGSRQAPVAAAAGRGSSCCGQRRAPPGARRSWTAGARRAARSRPPQTRARGTWDPGAQPAGPPHLCVPVRLASMHPAASPRLIPVPAPSAYAPTAVYHHTYLLRAAQQPALVDSWPAHNDTLQHPP